MNGFRIHVLSQSGCPTGHYGVTGSIWVTVDGVLHRVGRRLGFRFAAGLASSFSLDTGLAGTTTLPIFAFSRFWPCCRSPGDFPPEVRPFALEGHCSQPSPSQKEFEFAVRRRTNPYTLLFSRCYVPLLTQEIKSGNATVKTPGNPPHHWGWKPHGLRRVKFCQTSLA